MDPIYVLIIGIIMTVSGLGVFILGYKRRVPNALLWASVPFIHGLHEFADYWLDISADAPFVVERFELFFAFASSFALLAAAIEFNGVISRPNGKIAGLVGLTFVAFAFFTFPEEALETIHDFRFNFGFTDAEPFRFFFGFVLVLLAAIVIMTTYLYLYRQSKKGKLTLDKQTTQTSIVASSLLLVYAIFEGFDPELPFFVILRAVFLALFIIVPGYIVLVSKLGLQRIMVIDNSGILLFGYNFVESTCIFCEDADNKGLDETNDVLTAGFLAALTGYSGEVLNVGGSFSIRANRLYFVIINTEKKIYVLQSIDYDKNLERTFVQFVKTVQTDADDLDQPSDEINEKFTPIIQTTFAQYT